MIDHKFKSIEHWRIGPLRNQLGYVFAVAEIGSVWVLRWETPEGQAYYHYFNNHDLVVTAIELLNQGKDIK